MDTRIVKTKARLMSALSELTQNRDIKSITVSELCKKAGVNRTTFYKYYNVPADVGRESFDRHIEELMREIHENRSDGLYSTLLYCCRKYRENYLLVKQVFPGFSVSEKDLKDFYLKLQFPSVIGDESRLYFIAGGSSAVINDWLTNAPEKSPESIAAKLTEMIGGVLKSGS